MILLRALILAIVVSPAALAQDRAQGLFELTAPASEQLPLLPGEPNRVATIEPAPMPLLHEANFPTGQVPIPPAPVATQEPYQVQYQGLPQDSYFMVSSRCSIQDFHSVDPWGLTVHQRYGNGPLQPTNIASLASQLTPGMPVCIYVHGGFVEWESQCQEAHEAHRVFRNICPGQPLQMIFFTWPSDGPYTYLPAVDVNVRSERAEFNGFHLAWLISQIPESCPVCLIGHSFGSRAILSTLHLAGGGTVKGHYFTGNMGARRYRAVLAAAACDHHWLNPGQRYSCALPRVECLLNLQNRHDLPLTFYPLTRPFAHRALAKSGFTVFDRWKLGPLVNKIQQVDITERVGIEHYWPYYYCDPAIASTIRSYMIF